MRNYTLKPGDPNASVLALTKLAVFLHHLQPENFSLKARTALLCLSLQP